MRGWEEALREARRRHRVTLTGPRPDGTFISAAFDIFGFTSLREEGPIAPIEAMVHGVPLVSYAVGNLPDIIRTDVDGVIVPSGNVTAFSSALTDLVIDKVKRLAIGTAGARRVRENLSPEAMERATLRVYQAVVG